jgi:hypothetical protein
MCIAAGEYEQALLASLPEVGEYHHSFSAKFERKMRRLCHRVKYASTYSVMKRIACAIITIILCGSMLLMVNTDVRAAVIGWIKETYKSFTGYFFVDEVESDEPLNYEITDLPKGYRLLIRQETDAGNIAIYQDGDGKIMQLGCYTSESGIVYVGGYEYEYSQIVVSGKTADLYIAKDPSHSNTIIWKNAKGNVFFQLTAYLEKNSLIQVAECVSPIHDTKK